MTEQTISQRKHRLRVLACSVMLAATMSLAGCGGDNEMLASPGRQWFAEMLTMSSVADDMVEVQRLIIVDRKNSLKWSGELPFPPGPNGSGDGSKAMNWKSAPLATPPCAGAVISVANCNTKQGS